MAAVKDAFTRLYRGEASLEETFSDGLDDQAGLQEYRARRQELVTSEKKARWDRAATMRASQIEVLAAKIVNDIREDEAKYLFKDLPSEAIPEPDSRELGGKFLVNLERIEQSKLFKIVKEMPKGANLHLHFNAGLNPELFIKRARAMPTMFIRSTRPLVQDRDFDDAELVFSVLPADTESVDIFAEEYNPEFKTPKSQPWMKWAAFCEMFHTHRNSDAEDFVLKKMVISADETYANDATANGIWARFNQATRCFKGLFNYESAYRWYVGALLQHLVEERVMYVELRPMLLDKSIPTDDGLSKLDHAGQLRIILEEIEKSQYKRQFDAFPYGVKIIYCAPRSITTKMMKTELQDCIRLKRQFPNLVCGFDLVGAEDRPNSIHFYHRELLAFQRTCKEFNLSIPFLFHAGETLLDTGGTGNPEESNLYDALLLGSKRIGHGIALLRHPTLLKMARDQQTCIEVCPVSNEILHMCSNAKEHPLPDLLAQGIPCTICSDNPSLFSSSISHDFYQVLVGSPSMSLHGLRQLGEWSLQHSCLSRPEKNEALDIFARDWELFCGFVIENYDPKQPGPIEMSESGP